jgi:subtilisin family serine protease
VAGVNWNVTMVAIKFLSAEGSGVGSDAVDAIRYATRVGCDLTSNSWGGGGDQAMQDAIEDANAHGILFVAAAGNSSRNNDAFQNYPSGYTNDNIIAVAATDCNDALAFFSCYGLTTVDLGAPGVDIYSTFPTHMTAAMSEGKFPTNYAAISGTSMATPHVAGVCALAKAYRSSLTGAQIKKQVLLATDPLPKDGLGRSTQTNGRLNAYATLRTLQGPYPRPVNVASNDGTAGGVVEGKTLVFSPDSRHLAVVANRDGEHSLIIDGREGPAHARIEVPRRCDALAGRMRCVVFDRTETAGVLNVSL